LAGGVLQFHASQGDHEEALAAAGVGDDVGGVLDGDACQVLDLAGVIVEGV
jgi:hypothetical protein